MKKAIIGKKVGMTQIFDEAGKVIPVTVIEAGPCVVTAKMTEIRSYIRHGAATRHGALEQSSCNKESYYSS